MRVRYPEGRPSDTVAVANPSWQAVEAAVRQMDDDRFPIVILSCRDSSLGTSVFEDENAFNIIGGSGRYALFHMMADWQYQDPRGSTAPTRLWQSDQGYHCEERDVLTDIENALLIVKAFYETGSHAHLDTFLSEVP